MSETGAGDRGGIGVDRAGGGAAEGEGEIGGETASPSPVSHSRIVVAWVTLAFLWGTTWVAIRAGLQHVPPFLFAGVRFALAAVLVAGALGLRTRFRGHDRHAAEAPGRRATSPTPTEWRMLVTAGIQVFGLGYGLQFWGQQYVASGLSAIVFSTVPAVGMVFARVRVGEPITPARVLGLSAGIAGVGLISLGQIQGGQAGFAAGMAAFTVAVLCYANSSVTVRALGAHLDPLFLTMVQMGIGAVALLAVSAALEQQAPVHWSPLALGALAWLAVAGSALAFFLLYWLLRYLETAKVLSVLLADPVIALALGWLWFGESLGALDVAGAALVLGGLYLVLASPAGRR